MVQFLPTSIKKQDGSSKRFFIQQEKNGERIRDYFWSFLVWHHEHS